MRNVGAGPRVQRTLETQTPGTSGELTRAQRMLADRWKSSGHRTFGAMDDQFKSDVETAARDPGNRLSVGPGKTLIKVDIPRLFGAFAVLEDKNNGATKYLNAGRLSFD